jgi:hypothetical protein
MKLEKQIIPIQMDSRGKNIKEPVYFNSRGEITLKTWNIIKEL